MCGGVIDIRREKRMNEHDKERLCLKEFKIERICDMENKIVSLRVRECLRGRETIKVRERVCVSERERRTSAAGRYII